MRSLITIWLAIAQAFAADLATDWYGIVEQATVLQRQGNYRESLKLLKESLALASKIGADDLRVAVSLSNMGHLYQDLGLLPEAEEAYMAGRKKILRQPVGQESFLLMSSFNLAMLYIQMGRSKDSEKIWKKSIAPYLATAPPGDPLYPELLVTSAAVHLARKHYAEAERLYTLAIEAHRIIPDFDQVVSALSFTDRARTRVELGRREEAKVDLNLGIETMKRAITRPDHPFLAHFYGDVALTMAKLGETQQSEDTFRRALRIAKESSGVESSSYAVISLAFAKALQDWHRKDEAQTFREAAKLSFIPRSSGSVTLQELRERKVW